MTRFRNFKLELQAPVYIPNQYPVTLSFIGSYFLALTRKINLVSEFCAHWGRRGGEGPWVGMGKETELIRGGGEKPYERFGAKCKQS